MKGSKFIMPKERQLVGFNAVSDNFLFFHYRLFFFEASIVFSHVFTVYRVIKKPFVKSIETLFLEKE